MVQNSKGMNRYMMNTLPPPSCSCPPRPACSCRPPRPATLHVLLCFQRHFTQQWAKAGVQCDAPSPPHGGQRDVRAAALSSLAWSGHGLHCRAGAHSFLTGAPPLGDQCPWWAFTWLPPWGPTGTPRVRHRTCVRTASGEVLRSEAAE